jgi:hypothetical protein
LKIDISEKGTVYADVLNRRAAPENYVVGVDLGRKQENKNDELFQQSLCRRKRSMMQTRTERERERSGLDHACKWVPCYQSGFLKKSDAYGRRNGEDDEARSWLSSAGKHWY